MEHLSSHHHWSPVVLAPRHLIAVQARDRAMPMHGRPVSVRAEADLPHVCFPILIPRFLTRAHLPCSRICRWSRAITHQVTSPRTPLPHAPSAIVHTFTSCPYLLRYSLHPVRADSRRSNDPCARASRDARTARNGAAHPSELTARPAFAEAAVDRRRRAHWFTADLLHRQKWPAQGDVLGSADESRRALRGAHNAHDPCDPRRVGCARRGLPSTTSCR